MLTYLCLHFRAYLHVVILSLRSKAKGMLLTKESPGKNPNFRCEYKISRLRKSSCYDPPLITLPRQDRVGREWWKLSAYIYPTRDHGTRGEIEYRLSTLTRITHPRELHSRSLPLPSPCEGIPSEKPRTSDKSLKEIAGNSNLHCTERHSCAREIAMCVSRCAVRGWTNNKRIMKIPLGDSVLPPPPKGKSGSSSNHRSCSRFPPAFPARPFVISFSRAICDGG